MKRLLPDELLWRLNEEGTYGYIIEENKKHYYPTQAHGKWFMINKRIKWGQNEEKKKQKTWNIGALVHNRQANDANME